MRVLVVDDSILIRNIITNFLNQDPDIQVIGEANNGKIAVEKNKELKPDLIVMDLNMPVMGGLEATFHIMKDRPVPILIFSAKADAINSFRAYKYGAADIMLKPDMSTLNDPGFYDGFIAKLKQIVGKQIVSKPNTERVSQKIVSNNFKNVIIGASTGGPVAVQKILKGLPSDFSVGIVVVLHLEQGFDQAFTQWLDHEVDLEVTLAKDGDTITPGQVLVAPVGTHLVFDGNKVKLLVSAKVLNQRPSIDVTFKSAAATFHENALGILLTGMGEDGAEGCVEIKKSGGYTIAQDQQSSMIFGMPKAAIDRDGIVDILSLDDISIKLKDIFK